MSDCPACGNPSHVGRPCNQDAEDGPRHPVEHMQAELDRLAVETRLLRKDRAALLKALQETHEHVAKLVAVLGAGRGDAA